MSKPNTEVKKRGRPQGSSDIDHDKLFQSAIKVFANKGFEACTMTEISEAAGISRTSINYHFGSKEKLWYMGIDFLAEKFITKFNENKELNKGLDPIPLLKATIRQIVRFNANYPEFISLAYTSLNNKDERSKYIIEKFSIPTFDLTKDIFKQLRKEGKIKLLSKQDQSAILLGMTSFIFANSYLFEQVFKADPYREAQIDAYTDSVLEIFFNGILV